jgi:uncharacterized membrane protein YqjE
MGNEGEGAEPRAPGVLASLRNLAASAVGIARTRLDLLANELEEQRIRALELIVLGVVALLFGLVSTLAVTAWLVIALWDHYRLWTLGLLSVLYLGGFIAALLTLRAKAAERPKVFATSLAELRRDEDLLRS